MIWEQEVAGLNLRLGQYSFLGLVIVIEAGFIPLTAVHCVDDGFVRKQPVAWKNDCAVMCGVLVKRTQESMDRFTGRRDILLPK